MALERNVILVDNLRESLNLYQRSLVWAMTAAASFFILSFSLNDPKTASIPVLYGELSRPVAWYVAFGLFFVLGILAGSAIQNAGAILSKMGAAEPKVEQNVLEAALLYPSFATSSSDFIRTGTVLFSPLAVLIAFGLQLRREYMGVTRFSAGAWITLIVFVVLIVIPYARILQRVWKPFGSQAVNLGRTKFDE